MFCLTFQRILELQAFRSRLEALHIQQTDPSWALGYLIHFTRRVYTSGLHAVRTHFLYQLIIL